MIAGTMFLAAESGVAQTSAGVGEDATPLSAKGARIRIGGLWSSYDQRFSTSADGSTTKTGLFDGFRRDSLGTADMPILRPAENSIRFLSGLQNSFALTLGKLEAAGDVSKSVVPFFLDYGVTNRLFVSVLVPYVETTSNSRFVLNRGGQGANVGMNPVRSATGTAARATNTTVVQQIEASRTALTAEIARCGNAAETGGGCDAIRANPAAAQTLLDQAALFGVNISSLYGTSAAPGAPVVPISKSATQTAIEDRLAAIRNQFIGYNANQLDATSKPVGATTIYGSGGLQTIAQDSAFGLANDTLAIGGRAGMGDVDVSATFLWLNTGGSSQFDRLNSSRKFVRSSVTAGFRFGTATGARTGNPFDMPTGEGYNAMLAKSTTDFVWNRTMWVSGTVRYVKPLDDKAVVRFPPVADSTLFRPFTEFASTRKIGARTDIEIAPRIGIGPSFALSAAYTLSKQAESEITSEIVTLPDDSQTIESLLSPSTTVHGLQFGAAYSTLSAFTRGKSRWPLEVVYSHGVTLAGSGGVIPATSFDRIELRIYTRFPRR